MKPEEGFFQGTSENVPKVDCEMVHEFYMRDDSFVSSEIRGAKNLRSMREEYSSEAVGYVQIKRVGTRCLVKAKVTPEHRIREAGYAVTVEVEEKDGGSIISAKCKDCKASEAGCKHALALLSYLLKKTCTPSVTEVECYWKPSSLSAALKHGTVILARDIGRTSGLPVASCDSSFRDVYSGLPGVSSLALTARPIDNLSPLSLHRLVMAFKQSSTVLSAENFLLFMKENIQESAYGTAETTSRSQSACSTWFELRYGRITASYLYQASRCQTSDGTLVEAILGGYSFPATAAIERGRRLEKAVLKVAIGPCQSSGLIISPEVPIFGASPDAVTQDAVVEVKCPFKQSTVSTYLKDGKLASKAMAQIQLQMKLAGKKKGWFCVADPNFEVNNAVTKVLVHYDDKFLQPLLNDAMKFWIASIFPKLIH